MTNPLCSLNFFCYCYFVPVWSNSGSSLKLLEANFWTSQEHPTFQVFFSLSILDKPNALVLASLLRACERKSFPINHVAPTILPRLRSWKKPKEKKNCRKSSEHNHNQNTTSIIAMTRTQPSKGKGRSSNLFILCKALRNPICSTLPDVENRD